MTGRTAHPEASADARFMGRALELAARGAGQVAPNPKVGAVVVRDGEIVGEGWHRAYGAPHAEVDALHAAGNLARGATLYVTLEPCAHQGKTPPCTDALIQAGVARVVYACPDPNPVAAGGAAVLRAAGIAVETGTGEAAARTLNAAFLHAVRGHDRPFVTLKLALSLDGAITDAAGGRRQLTGNDAMAAVHAMRADADAVAVGSRTARIDDPLLTVRLAPAPRVAPMRVVFDRTVALPAASRLVRTAREVPVVVVTDGRHPEREALLAAEGVQALHGPTLAEALRALRQRGVRHLLVEGGATLASALVGEGLVHQVVIFQAPVVLGAGARAAFADLPAAVAGALPAWRLLERQAMGEDLMMRYALFGD
jgi:diaminohydroxyphosphoribosylaminopyrimidine deaminase/5-amino-6-(5-phosphoribosylamino)uracil reductase